MKSNFSSIGIFGLVLALALGSQLSWGKSKPKDTPTDFSTLECSTGYVHERLQGVLWMQRSGEFRANVRQAYNSARVSLDTALQAPDRWKDAFVSSSGAKPTDFAIVIDVDETVLDNTPEELQLIARGGRKYDSDLFKEWEMLASAKSLTGAKDFLAYAASRNVKVFYVTNRENEERLRENLKGFPLATDEDVVLVAGDCPNPDPNSLTDKECRRQIVANKHRVLIAIGDDYGDFRTVYNLDSDKRIALAEGEDASRWGREWVIVPNPLYGSFDRAFYSGSDLGPAIIKKKCEALVPLK
jgi:5'-nucleotidase (lipoprotein e(P4) family)